MFSLRPKGTEERNHDLARVYREYFEHSVHPGNLAAFIDSYVRRTDLGISRSTPTSESCPAGRRLSMTTTLQMPIINVCGALSPHQEDTVTLNSRLDPTKSSWMKVSALSSRLSLCYGAPAIGGFKGVAWGGVAPRSLECVIY